MTKRHFIALADRIREVNLHGTNSRMVDCEPFTPGHIAELASFCKEFNPRFNEAPLAGIYRGRVWE